jgi:DNA-binding SARP family transcriptional activator
LAPGLRVNLLGDFRLSYDEAPVHGVDTPRLQSLLAYLVLHRDAPQLRHHLAFLFWPDSTEVQALTNLRNLLHHLRHDLPEADRFLYVDAQTLQWRPDVPFAFDVAELESAVEEAQRAEQAGDRAALRAALERVAALYRGDLLPSCYDDWILPERERLRQTFIDKLEQLIQLLESQRDYPAAIAYAQRLLRHDPLREATYRRLMRLYALNDDRAAAVRTYHACATILQRELDVGPSPATREVYERLLQREAPPAPAPPSPAELAATLPMVGRDREWMQLQEAWRAAAAGEARFVLLIGEVGIGKTRLVEELLTWADRQGIVTASARCYAAEGGLPYAPVVAWLRARPLPPLENVWLAEVARLLPELRAGRPDLPAPGPLSEVWQRQGLFDALAQAVVGSRQPKLLFIDDLQWCDHDTLEWLHYLMRFEPQAPFLVVATLLAEERAAAGPLATLLEGLRRSDRLTEIELGPLGKAETVSLAAHMTGRALDPALEASLYQGSEGNPLFVVEMVRVGLSRGGPWGVEHGQEMSRTALPLPPKVRMVIEARLAQLSPSARELAELAATVGREFTFAVLAEASDGDRDGLVRDLDELWRRRIVRERGAEAYDFSHDRIREVVYAGLSAARRRRLHRRVAQALEAVHAGDLAPVSPQVAVHYAWAGLPERAIPYYLRAAEVTQRLYASEEVIEYLGRALALLETEPPGERGEERRETAARVYEELGDAWALIGQYERAGEAYRRALDLGSRQDRVRQARLHRKLGGIRENRYQHDEALQAYDLAEAALGEEPAAVDRGWRQEWVQVQTGRMWVHYWQGRIGEMLERVERTRALTGTYDAPLRRIRFFFSLNLAGLRHDCYVGGEGSPSPGRICLAASRESSVLSQRVVGEFSLALAHFWCGERDVAEGHLRASLELSEQIGGLPWRCRCLNYLGIVSGERERTDEMRHYVSQSLEAAMGLQMPEYVGAAQANLAWLAWREGDLSQAQEHGRSALASWQQTDYAFKWLALWPLIAVALAQDRISEALEYARMLLEPDQQHLPDALSTIVQDAIRAGEQDRPGPVRAYMDRAISLAQEIGYL